MSTPIKNMKDQEYTYVYSKQVNDSKIVGSKKTRKFEKDKMSNVINSLLPLGKTMFLNDLYLNQNCHDWINAIFSLYPNINERDVKELLNDFTDSMNTRMREDEKYVVCILTSNFLILCHSRFGEETITPKYEVMERMLDKDNVLRFVYFEKEIDDIKLIFFEDSPSVFFANWLGIPEKEAFGYLGGKNKFYGEINGSTFVFEFTDDDFDEKFIQNKTFSINENQLILPHPIQNIPLVQIRVGRRPYDDIEDFIQDFFAKRYDLTFYQNEYIRIIYSVDFDLWSKKIIDEKFVVRDSNRKVLVKKRNTHFFIIFSNKEIDIRPSFLSEIKSKLLNNEPLKIFHAGGKVSTTPLCIKNLEIYNKLDQKISKPILDYYSNLKIKDEFEEIFLYILLEILSRENSSKSIHYFLKQLANSIIPNTDFSKKFANSEDAVLELKSRDYVSGRDKQVVERISNDIKTKIKKSQHKIYIFGANEDTKDFELLPFSRFGDDRVKSIENSLKISTQVSDLHLLKIPANEGKECLLILYLRA